MAPASPAPQPDEPFFFSWIDLFSRVAVGYFIVIGAAVVTDMVRDEGLVFRSWASFAIQAVAAFVFVVLIARQTLGKWQHTARRFVPANTSSAVLIIGLAVAAGTLLGGFFPDAIRYQRRAPEPFLRTMCALTPLAIAVFVVLRSSPRVSAAPAVPAPPQQPQPTQQPLTGAARDAAISALEIFDRGERAIDEWQQRVAWGRAITRADADALWAALEGSSYIAHLRQMPPDHAITRALRDAVVAQTDAVYLIGLGQGAHDAMGHTAESARQFVSEVAARRGRPGSDAETLAPVARREAKALRDAAAGLLQASRFSTPSPSA